MNWNDGCSTARVWTAAALVLSQVHRDHPEVPMDPELFVAAQSFDSGVVDAWSDLASPAAADAYRKRVRGIVRQLERELRREIDHAERLIRNGRPVRGVLCDRDARLSPLGRYIVARRAVRLDLAAQFETDVFAQHRSCPLYRSACLAFLPAEQYPVDETLSNTELKANAVVRTMSASLN
ncbi:hypothetical protein [Paludisphaera borealis]|nr:hypothetical protein [Paludisphaera borealis]